MKVVTALLSLVAVVLSAAAVIPAPNLTLLALTIAVPELAPWLAVPLLLAGMGALLWQRGMAAVLLAAALIVAWPLTRIGRVDPGIGLPDLYKPLQAGDIQPETLPLNIRYYRPSGSGPHSAVIQIYGGAWQRGSPESYRQFASYLAARGYAVFAIDYRHAPAARFPAQIEDVRAAIRFVHDTAIRYQVDPERLVLCGRSAGGQLALLAAYEEGPVPIRAVISFYAPSDLARGYLELPSPDPIDVRLVLETYLGGPPVQMAESYRAASPVSYANRRVPPTLLIQGSRDHIVKPEFTRALAQTLRASGNRVVLLELPWAEHAFDAVFQGIGNRVALRAVEKFLEAETQPYRKP